ncbi:DNRLRE domain-containing protein [Paenibacillus sp. HWE-109]|uniref:CBM96 family carbohydrate-binding protein n=1 Tax=Paenibacillus sp. HWE-109 TaxID=1306526 RepID=UPI001EDDD5CB|nr:DNRLRE domain-containing protein [Paenibacillus sp. HWE-109]UKS29774.1 DNRLRE domain-containing protein [Paenibacillus sp. HWE-109]
MFKKRQTKTAVRIIASTLAALCIHTLVVPVVPGYDKRMTVMAETIPANPIQLSPVEDTYVNGGANVGKNYGTATTLLVKNYDIDSNLNRQTYMKYDLSSISGEIGTAKLKVYAVDTENSTIGMQVYGMEDDSWKETAATWTNKPAFEHYIANLNVGKTASWYEINVTAFVKSQLALDRKASFAFVQQAAKGQVVSMNSRENVANTPYLEISTDRLNASAPSWPNNSTVQVASASGTSLQLSWTSAAALPASYTIYQNGTAIGTVGGGTTSYSVTGLQTNQKYTFKIEAGSSSNQWSNDGPYVTFTVPTSNGTILTPVEDSYVQAGGNAGNNYGTAATLVVKNYDADLNLRRQAYLKFDLHAYTGEIGTAKLKVYAVDGENSNIDVQAYGMENDTWKESTVTWNNKPDIDHYLASVNMGKTAGWYEYDVTAYIKQQLALDAVASIALTEQAAQGHAVVVNSKENAVNRPYLELSASKSNASAPVWPGGGTLGLSNLSETGLQLNWSSATDPAGVTGYKVYKNGTMIANVGGNVTSFAVTGLKTEQHNTFKVEAGNALNQWSNDGPFNTAVTPSTKLVQLRAGNVFVDQEPVGFKVLTTRPSVTWTVYDYEGSMAAGGSAAATSQTEALISVPSMKYGYFMLQVRAELAGSDPVTIKTPFAVLPPLGTAGSENSPFGMATHLHRYPQTMTADILNLMKSAGMRLIRDGFEWPGIEKQQGIYSFGPQPDYYMNMLDPAQFDFLFVSGFTNPFYDNNSTPYTAAGREGFANYMKAYVDHYDGKLDAVEVYNEFYGSFGDRGNGPADSKPEYYYPLLKKSYETIKAAHPNMPVLGTSTVGNLTWIEDVLKLGGMAYMDGFSIHPYLYPGAPEGYDTQIDNLKTLIRTYNNGNLKPIWINETGWPTELDTRGVDEKTQANYLVRAYVVAIANGVEKVVWYDAINDGISNVNEDNFGIIRNPSDSLGSLTPKPAYASYAVMTRMLVDAQFVKRDTTDSDIRSYDFNKNGEHVRTIWAPGKSIPVVLQSAEPLEITDMMGNSNVYTPFNGKIYVTLNDEPIFVNGVVNAVARDNSFTLQGEAARIGDAMSFMLTAQNTTNQAFALSLKIGADAFPVTTGAGGQTVQTIQVPNAGEPGARLLSGVMMHNNDRIGLLRSSASALPPYEVQVRPVITNSETMSKSLQIRVRNESHSKPLQARKIEWQFGTQSGTFDWQTAIAADSDGVAEFPLTGFGLSASSAIKVKVYFDGFDPYTYSGAAEFNPIFQRAVAIDGSVDPETAAAAPTIDLSKGSVKMTGYQGAADLSGQIWLNFDASHLYLTAKIKDDSESSLSSGADIWNNDSIQFAISDGLPGENPYWHEFGISQTPAGPQIYRWLAPPGTAKGAVTKGNLAVTRDEAQKLTVYELALPLSEVTPILPQKNGVISFSILVNDNDGSGRKGYIEWGGGIGDSKLAAKFRSMQWLVSDLTAPTASVAYSTTSSTAAPVIATITPSEPVTITNNGGSNQYTFLANGSFTFEFVDSAGNSGKATATVANIVSGSTGVPGKPVLSDNNGYDTGIKDGNYQVTMNLWWGNNGSIYKLFENDTLIDTQMLADHAPNAQSAVTDVTYKANGTYRYVAELTNAYGTTRSDPLTVQVTGAAPAKPELSSDNWDGDGVYKITMNMWWGTNGTQFRLYENGVLIDTKVLSANSPQAQSAVIAIRDKAKGSYSYRAELVNDAGTTSSEILSVVVK